MNMLGPSSLIITLGDLDVDSNGAKLIVPQVAWSGLALKCNVRLTSVHRLPNGDVMLPLAATSECLYLPWTWGGCCHRHGPIHLRGYIVQVATTDCKF